MIVQRNFFFTEVGANLATRFAGTRTLTVGFGGSFAGEVFVAIVCAQVFGNIPCKLTTFHGDGLRKPLFDWDANWQPWIIQGYAYDATGESVAQCVPQYRATTIFDTASSVTAGWTNNIFGASENESGTMQWQFIAPVGFNSDANHQWIVKAYPVRLPDVENVELTLNLTGISTTVGTRACLFAGLALKRAI